MAPLGTQSITLNVHQGISKPHFLPPMVPVKKLTKRKSQLFSLKKGSQGMEGGIDQGVGRVLLLGLFTSL